MGPSRNRLMDYLVYLAVRLVAMAVHVVGPSASYAAAAVMGDWMHRLYGRGRKRAMEHLARALPDVCERRRRGICRASMRNLARLAMDVLLIPRYVNETGWRRYVRIGDVAEPLREAVRRRTGMIVVSGHFGNWEVFGYTTAMMGFHGYALARALDNPYLNDYLLGIRERNGMTILDKSGAMAQMDGIMRGRNVVGFIADQDAGKRGVFVDFFHRAASTYRAPALMAIRYNVPIVVVYARRLGERFAFEIGAARMIRPAEWADADDPVRWITQEYTAALERVIRTAPEQYLWSYRRWKTRPRDETPTD